MAKFKIIAHGEEEGMPTRVKIVDAKNKGEALEMAWEIFPEYEDISVKQV